MENKVCKFACIIMASGEGKRFGSNKLMANFAGQPLISYVLSATQNIFEKRIVVTRHENVAAFAKEREIDFILHQKPHRNDTVRLGLEKIGAGVTHCLFCMGDQPLITRASIEKILLAAQKEPNYIWRFIYQETLGAPVLFPAQFFDELKDLPEGKGGGVLLKKYADRVRTISVENPQELMDIDTQKDLGNLLKYLEQL
ncbi:MAG: nucleotidyltransferase family protein [Phascolarctobacterium sp.]|nr:nucleotidyltransferase family protein [Phascolarctobacterium sp.]